MKITLRFHKAGADVNAIAIFVDRQTAFNSIAKHDCLDIV